MSDPVEVLARALAGDGADEREVYGYIHSLLELVRATAEAEREECAKVAEGCPDSHWGPWTAAAIRNRSKT